ncbi:polyhydroxyalkanoate depolymerase [Rhizorhabdus dicambivorans]|uniref:Polyhydroxyalkanoate depolymerase n=1 Tax=Rhizorhabdus dicambivorans TaxID=1850238 RepID=A0A2A4FYV2_9SPHN|nr:polyhydroxyalkanoate depolymerase [Rhizorhabdus dicambivorans]ATE63152.1 polyhydroxyalkanoate depolymerase [Rhizorhabdus dicambivorans]PCE43398.1 polyhydroxyalkanoate depolymerase [Rhizorhabdus dicambivorans]
MLYQFYQAMTDMAAPMRMFAAAGLRARPALGRFGEQPVADSLFAALDMVAHTRLTADRPAYGIDRVVSGNSDVAVREEVVAATPFADLLHFAKDEGSARQPKLLLVAPISGHFATLLRNTVQVLLRDHDVYITDWKNARDVPVSAGRFGFDDYVDHLVHFLEEIGPPAHMVAVCQPCVPALAAVALMSTDANPATPRSLTLMGGPVDVRVNPTVVNDLANSHDFAWFEDNLIHSVPWRYEGRGRKVYPGFLQLTAFMSMNSGRHFDQHRALYQHLADGEAEQARAIRDFYDEYFAVLDLTAEFYLETIDRVFQRALLAKGELDYRGRRIDPGMIRRTALLTVEGERDDICAVGQTAAAHDLCTGLRPHMKQHYLQAGVGHYGVFSGRKWESQIYPQVRSFILGAE